MASVFPYLLLAAAVSGAGFPIGEQVGQVRVAEEEQNTIVVRANRLEDVKINYRLRGGRLHFCGRRDSDQDLSDVRVVCHFVQQCVASGQRSHRRLDACVDFKIAQQRLHPRD